MSDIGSLLSNYCVDHESGCWRWLGSRNPKGYGIVSVKGRNRPAHRLSHEFHIGEIPEGFDVDHVADRGCLHRDCINPDHLEAVTHRENLRRSSNPVGINARKTECDRGHPFSGENLIDRGTSRECRTCKRLVTELKRANFLDQCPYCPRTTRVGNMYRHIRRMHPTIQPSEWPTRFERVEKTAPALIGQPPRIVEGTRP